MRIVNSESADAALTEAALYLESERSGQGLKFLEEFEIAIRQLRDFPESGRPIGPDLRRILIKKYKFVIHYRYYEKESLIRIAKIYSSRSNQTES